MSSDKKFVCTICKRIYSSIASLSNHRRITHSIRKHNIEKHYFCKYCNVEYASVQSRWTHQKTCKSKNDELNNTLVVSQTTLHEMEKIKDENQKLKELMEKSQEIADKSQEIIKLQKKLLNSKRIDNKTFKAVNKILMDRSYRNTNNHHNTNSNNSIVNNNTYQIFSLGNEDLTNVLTLQQKKMIMNSRLGSLEKMVEITHCGDYNQFKNIIITNLKDNFAYRYDDKKGYFVAVSKSALLEDVVAHRVTDIEAIYDELQTANKIDAKTKKLIQDFLDRMGNDDAPFFDNNDVKYDNFKTYKINNIKILLYNNQDKITKDIALLISDNAADNITLNNSSSSSTSSSTTDNISVENVALSHPELQETS